MRLYANSGRRQEALAQFQQLKRSLKREFEDEPDDETRRLYQELLTRTLDGDDSAPSASQPNGERTTNLPTQLTSFVGRQRELEQIATAFDATRLLTLTGVGDPARLGSRSSWPHALGERFQDGVWLVELAAIADPALIWRRHRGGARRAAETPERARRSLSPSTSATASCSSCLTTAST